jgi:CubicO group peptidase (beta-lactamase class C family)
MKKFLQASCVVLALLGPGVALSYPPPPPDPSLPTSTVEPAVQQLRRAMLDPDVNSLTFHNMDQLFTTRTVGRAGPVWGLARADRALDFTYQFKGQTHAALDVLERTYTNALLVMKDGRIVYETYRNNTGPSTRFIGFSMTKSMTSVLIGCAIEEKRIRSIDDPITRYLPELAGGGYDGVTIRQILQMRSGVDYEERYDFANPGVAARNHEQSLIRNVVRFADAARTIKRKHPPGAVWEYKTLDTAVLGWLLERVSGSSVAAYTASRLWEPLGAEADGYYIMDGTPGAGREFSGAGFNATLRDFARFGQMVLDGGIADGRRIVSREWLAESTRPTGGPGPGYGYQWWMGERPGSFQAIGLQGQYVYVDPSSRTVIVKLSHFPPGNDPGTDMAHLESAAFFAAASSWTPR